MRAYLRIRRDENPALFVANDEERLTCDGLRPLLERRAKRANLDTKPKLHDFRRAFSLNMLRSGVDIFVLQRLQSYLAWRIGLIAILHFLWPLALLYVALKVPYWIILSLYQPDLVIWLESVAAVVVLKGVLQIARPGGCSRRATRDFAVDKLGRTPTDGGEKWVNWVILAKTYLSSSYHLATISLPSSIHEENHPHIWTGSFETKVTRA